MPRTFAVLAALFCCVATARAGHYSVEVVADRTAVEPGGSVTVALVFTIDPHWHIYWLNPGDTGVPPKVKWTLPPGVTASPLRFPTPRRIDVGEGLTAFGYENTATLLSTIAVPADAKGNVELRGTLSVVVCAEECLLERQSITLNLPIGQGAPNAADRFAKWQAALPHPPAESLQAVIAADGKSGALDVPLHDDVEPVDFFPPPAPFAAYDKPAVVNDGGHRIYRQPFRILPGVPLATRATGIVVTRSADGKVEASETIFAYPSPVNGPSH